MDQLCCSGSGGAPDALLQPATSPLGLIGLIPHCCAAQPPTQLLRGMDLYVGAGGLGYLDFVSLKRDKKTGRKRPDPNG